jgi:HK97 family phage prohead protease
MPVLTHAAEGKVHDRKDIRCGTEVKVLDDELGVCEAIVSVTNVLDDVNDIIEAGAYASTLKNRRPKGVWSHDWDLPIARTLDVAELMPGDPRLPEKIQALGGGGLLVKMQFNLNTQRGSDAYADVKFFGENGEQEWSIGYSVPPGESKMDTKTGIRYIKALDLFEYSPVLFGANAHTDTLSIKAAVGEHKTGTSDEEWGEGPNKKNLLNDAGDLRKAFAWADPDCDPSTKDAYAFMHHFVRADGSVYDASTDACARGIAVLSGASIPDAEKQGVYDHLAKHLRDAGQEPVPFEDVVVKQDPGEPAGSNTNPDPDGDGDDDRVNVVHTFLPFYGNTTRCSICRNPRHHRLHHRAAAEGEGKAQDDNSPGMMPHEYQPPEGGEDDPTAPCLVCGLLRDDPIHPGEGKAAATDEKPYHITEQGDEYCVVNSETGKTVPGGCHSTRADANDHMRALYANVEDASKVTPPPCDGWFTISIGDRASATARCSKTMDHAGLCGFADQEEAVTTPAVKETAQPAGGDAAQQAEGEGMPDPARRAAEGGAGTVTPEEQAEVIEADVEENAEGKETPAPQPTVEGKSDENETEDKGDGDEGGDGNSSHAKFDGTHTHAHDTNKPGGGNHTHSHSHDGDADHGHGHPKKEAEGEGDDGEKSAAPVEAKATQVSDKAARLLQNIDEAVDEALDELGIADHDSDGGPTDTDKAAAVTGSGLPPAVVRSLQNIDEEIDGILDDLGIPDTDDDAGAGDTDKGGRDDVHILPAAAEGDGEEKINVTLAGSFEDIGMRVSSAVQSSLPAPSQDGSEQVAWIEATFPDRVLVAVAEFSISEPDDETGMPGGIEFLGEQYISYPYSVAEGVITLGDPEPVDVSGVVTPRKALEERLESKLSAAVDEKVGRTLSAANAEKIRGAVLGLIDVLKAAGIQIIDAEAEADGKSAEEAKGPGGGSVSDKSWDGDASRFDDDEYKMSCAVCRSDGDSPKQACSLPHHEPGGAVNRNGVHAAAQRISSVKNLSDEERSKAQSHLRSHYKNDLKEDPPDSIKLADDSEVNVKEAIGWTEEDSAELKASLEAETKGGGTGDEGAGAPVEEPEVKSSALSMTEILRAKNLALKS